MQEIVLVNVGNTNTQVAVAAGRELDGVRSFPTSGLVYQEEFREFAVSVSGRPWFVGSVVPAVSRELEALVGLERTRFLSVDMITDLDFSQVTAETIGADRLANAVAAVDAAGVPAIVVDCGTAITTEVIDRERRFRGGTIMPGRRLQRQALAVNTGLLPDVELATEKPNVPGTETASAIIAGIDVGLLGAVRTIIAETRGAIGEPDCPVLTVGGDATFFMEALPELTPGGVDLTLRGLALIALNACLGSVAEADEKDA